jgi:hypothetical protein
MKSETREMNRSMDARNKRSLIEQGSTASPCFFYFYYWRLPQAVCSGEGRLI